MRTVTREQKTTIRRRPNKTTTRSRSRTRSQGYGALADGVARAAAVVGMAAFRTARRVRTSKPMKTMNKKGPRKAIQKMAK